MKLTFAALALSAIVNVAWVVYRVMALA
jgi:hypothetical protein